MDNLRLLTILMICYNSLAVKIDKLIVPQEIQYGKKDDIILDCQYQLHRQNDTVGLVIKWYFQNQQLIYQWIPGKDPQAVGEFKDKIDLSYKVAGQPYEKYRALRITTVTPDLTGAYTCSVSCFNDESAMTKEMIVYESPKEFTFEQFRNNSELLCSVYDISPEPVISVYPIGINLTQIDDDDDKSNNEVSPEFKELSNGFYNVTKSFKYNPLEITEPTLFICELTIPNTRFRKILNQTFYPDGEPMSTTEYDNDYETSTISSIADNAELIKASSVTLYLTVALIFLLEHL